MFNRRLLGLAARRRAGLAGLVLIGLAITATYAGQGLLIARVIADVLDGDLPYPAMAGILALQAARALLLWTREIVATTVAAGIKDDLRDRLLERLFALGPGYTTGTRTGRIQSTVVDGVEAMDGYFANFLPQLLSSLIGAVALITYVWVLDPVVGATIAGCAVLVAAAPRISRRLMSAPMAKWFTDYRALYADTLDVLQGMVTLKGINAHRRRGEQLAAQSAEFATTSTRLVTAVAAYEVVVGLAAGAGTSLAIGIGALRTVDGLLDIATLLVILLLSRECFRPLTDLSRAFHGAYPGIAAADGIFALLDEEPAVTPAGSVPAVNGDIRLDGVTFAYRPDTTPALRDVTFTAAQGATTAIVGRSGAGKSTVVALLLRFFNPQHGRITIGGRDLPEIDDPRALISVVSQDTYLFHGTVRDNLLLARPTADSAAIEQAARAAAAHDFITALPEGYDTMIGERGTRLSGGERQRIAIARALLKDAPILILDEATSAIDSANEAVIQQALGRLTARRTTLVIAHRLSTVRNADHIVVLDDATVAEQGPPDRLLAEQGVYHRLAAAQAGAA